MNPQLIPVLLCLGFVLLMLVGFEIAVFRMACLLCRVPQPGLAGTAGMVLVLLVVPAIVDGISGAILTTIYEASKYPLWEAGIIQFFLALPVHMAVCSVIHARMMNLRVGQGLSVWFVEKLLKVSLLLLVVGVIAGLLLLGQMKK